MKVVLQLIILCLLVTLVGCDSRPSAESVLAPAERLSDVDDHRVGESVTVAVTEQQAAEFAEKWQKAVVESDVATVRSLVDWNGILNRALAGFDVNEELRQGLISGATSPEAIQGLIGTIAKEVNEGGSYRLVRVARRGGHSHITLRLLNADGALNYHDLRLKRINDTVIADRLFFASTGESYGDTLRTIGAGVMHSQNSLTSRLTGAAKKELVHLQQQGEMSDAMRQGDPEKALAIYAKMSPELQQQKMPMLMRIMVTDSEDQANYMRAIDDFVAKFPDDAAVGLITFDAAVIREDHDLLLKSYEQLQRFTGGDPLLTLMVGGVLANQGKPDEAKALTESIDPLTLGLATAHDFKLSVAMAAEDHPGTLKELLILRDEYGYGLSDLDGVEGFEKFVASPEYAQWQASAKGSANTDGQ